MSAIVSIIPEKAWQAQVVELAKLFGWMAYHVYDSRRSEPGFPDLFLLRGNRLVVAELKSEAGVLSQAQKLWLEAFSAVGAEVHVWKPSDFDQVVKVLR